MPINFGNTIFQLSMQNKSLYIIFIISGAVLFTITNLIINCLMFYNTEHKAYKIMKNFFILNKSHIKKNIGKLQR